MSWLNIYITLETAKNLSVSTKSTNQPNNKEAMIAQSNDKLKAPKETLIRDCVEP